MKPRAVLSTLAQARLTEMQTDSEWRIEAVIVCPGCGELEDDCGCGEDGPVAVLVTL
jgi:hypothetical protein